MDDIVHLFNPQLIIIIAFQPEGEKFTTKMDLGRESLSH